LRQDGQIRFVLENGLLFRAERILARVSPSDKIFPPTEGRGPFLAVVISRKKAKRAVVRNRMKRQLREAFRKKVDGLPEKTAWVLIARRAEKKTLYRDLEQDLSEIIKKYREKSESKTTV